MEIAAQYATALLLCSVGALLGAVHDVYRGALREWPALRRLGSVFDLLFWVFATIFVFTVLLGTDDGDVRLVVFVLLAIGWVIYHKTAQPLVVASTRLVARAALAVVRFLRRAAYVLAALPVIASVRAVRVLLRGFDRVLQACEDQIAPIVSWVGVHAIARPLQKMFFGGQEIAVWTSKRMKTTAQRWHPFRSSGHKDSDDEQR
ncbi:MAG: spore cortex biosynthesis protein YabQ [Firmicutes bacterium]|nr:spore cortex biosynthesis protein YabQ [Bacillota bacterium]